jgi:sec-independent protein translocase protein TatC
MFYFIEVYYRSTYIVLSFILSFSIFYFLQDYIVSFLLLKNNSITINSVETAFVLNSPLEIMEAQLYIAVLFSFIFTYPIFIWNFYFFIYSSLSKNENKKFKNYLITNILNFLSLNLFIYIFVMPVSWYIFEYFNFSILQNSSINVEYEPNFKKYLILVYIFIKTINIGYAISASIIFAFKNLSLKVYFIYNKVFILFIIFCFFIVLTVFLDVLIFASLTIIILFSLKKYLSFIIIFYNFKKIIISKHYAIKKNSKTH